MKLFDHQEHTAQFLLDTPRAWVQSDPGCVDASTEFLTPTGWKRIDQYQEGDLVAQYDPETGTAEFVKPDAYVKKPCEEMFHFQTQRGVDQMLSPEHRMLLFKRDGVAYEVLSASTVAELHGVRAQGYKRYFKTTFALAKGEPHLTDEELRLQVAVMADGYLTNQTKCSVNIKRQDKRDRLRHLLGITGTEFTVHLSAEGYERFYFTPPLLTKTPTDVLWDLPDSQRRIVVDECAYWDGSRRKAGAVDFCSRDKHTADWVQFCAVTSGRTATLLSYKRGDGIDYVVHIRKGESRVGLSGGSSKATVERVPAPDGFKYCFTIPTTFFVARRNGRVFTTGNTGKTISTLEAYRRFRRNGGIGKMLVLAPLSILQPAWGGDIGKWLNGEFSYVCAYAKNRLEAFRSDADIILTNHDAVKWLIQRPELLSETFPISDDETHWLVIDEATAYKNPTSQRSKAMLTLRTWFKRRIAMSGTPTAKDVLDIFHPTLIVDDGVHLGNKFFSFRNQVASPVQVGPDPKMVKWVPHDTAEEFVAQALTDICIRYRFEDCIDIPPNQTITYNVDLPAKLRKLYDQMLDTSVIEDDDGNVVSAVNAGVRVRKLLQLLTGTVYDQAGVPTHFHTDRYELVMQLVQERDQSVVAFNWKHEVEALTKLANKLKISYGVIDGSVKHEERTKVVDRFQNGELQVIFAHPQSAGHGLTLTAGTATIWCSPTYNAEHYQQFNQRIYRAGQTKATQTIHIAARDTAEEDVYEQLSGKLSRMEDLLALFATATAA